MMAHPKSDLDEIFASLGVTNQELSLVNRLGEAHKLVQQGKLREEVYDELVKASKKKLEADGHSDNTSKGFWGKMGTARRAVTSRFSSHTNKKLQVQAEQRMKEFNDQIPMSKVPVIEGFLLVHDEESDAVYHRVTNRAKTLLKDRISADRDGVDSSAFNEVGQGWKRKFVILYRNCIHYYKVSEREYEEYQKVFQEYTSRGQRAPTQFLQLSEPEAIIVLTPDSFVSEAGQGPEDLMGHGGIGITHDDDDDDADSDYTDGGNIGASEPLHLHKFYVSDLKSQVLVAAENAEFKQYWMHTIAMVLKKLRKDTAYFNAPLLLDRPVPTVDQVKLMQAERQAKYEQSLISMKKREEEEARKKAKIREEQREAEEEIVANAKLQVKIIKMTNRMKAKKELERQKEKKKKKGESDTSRGGLLRRKFSTPTSVLFKGKKKEKDTLMSSSSTSSRRLSVQSDDASAILGSLYDSDVDSVFGSGTIGSNRSAILKLTDFEDSDEESDEELDQIRRTAAEYKMKAYEHTKEAQRNQKIAKRHKREREKVQARLNETVEALRIKSRQVEMQILAECAEVKAKLDEAKQRRKSMVEGGDVDPKTLEAFDKERKQLMAKLAALQSALAVDLDNLDWDGTLEDAEEKMKESVQKLNSEDPKIQHEGEQEFEQWDRIIRNHADYRARELKKAADWEAANKEKNQEALKTMRSLVPPDIIKGVTIETLMKLTKGKLNHRGAKRVIATQILRFLYMSPEAISKIHVADLGSRFVPQGLDIVELRAIYCCLPDEFQNDRDGRKKAWLESTRAKLMNFTEREANGKLTEPEKRNYAYRAAGDLPKVKLGGATSGPAGRGKPQTGKLKNKLNKGGRKNKPGPGKIDTSALQAALAGKLADLNGGGPPAKLGAGKNVDDAPPLPFGRIPPQVLASRKAMAGGESEEDAAPASPFGGAIPARVLASRRMMEEKQEVERKVPDSTPIRKASTVGGFSRPFLSELTEGYENLTGGIVRSDNSSASTKRNNDPINSGDVGLIGKMKGGLYSNIASVLEPNPEPPIESSVDQVPPKKHRKKAKANKTVQPKLADEPALYSRRSILEDDMDMISARNTPRKKSIYQARPQGKTKPKSIEAEIEEQVDELVRTIRKHGASRDPHENGAVTITYWDLQLLLDGSEKLTGLLLNAKKKNRIVYDADMLFDESHRKVKITVVF